MQNIINLHKLIRQFNKLGNKLGVGKNKMSLKDAFKDAARVKFGIDSIKLSKDKIKLAKKKVNMDTTDWKLGDFKSQIGLLK